MNRRRHTVVARRTFYRWRRAALIAVVLAGWIAVRWWQDGLRRVPPESLSEDVYRVERVVDGDTLLLANQARVRLQGIDTPETKQPNHPVERFGPEAAEFTRQFVSRGNGNVRLQFDRERIDKYGRFLAYVWVEDRMLNEELVRAGLATAETGFRYSDSMKRRFRRAEEEARAEGRGIWSLPRSEGAAL
jgi:micrococcal nuclease